MPDSPRFTGSGPYGNDPLLQIHITPMEAHHLPRPDSGVQHYPNSRSAVTKFRSFHHRPKASYLFRSQNGNRPFTKRRRVHTGDRIFPAPSAPQGKGQNAAHHRPALVTLPVGCKSSLQKMGAMLRRQLPDRKPFNSGHLRIKAPVKYLISRNVVGRRLRFAFSISSTAAEKETVLSPFLNSSAPRKIAFLARRMLRLPPHRLSSSTARLAASSIFNPLPFNNISAARYSFWFFHVSPFRISCFYINT